MQKSKKNIKKYSENIKLISRLHINLLKPFAEFLKTNIIAII